MDRIEQLLDDDDLKWADVARALGTSDQAVHNWKKRGIPQHAMPKIAKFLGCSIDWLYTGQGAPYPAGSISRAANIPEELSASLSKTSPRSYKQLMQIATAASEGRLSEADIKMLSDIAKRLEKGSTNHRDDYPNLQPDLADQDT